MAGVQAFLGRAPPPRLVWSTMQIAVFGRGNVGGGLADIWERAGHQVTRLGRDGGDVSGADAVSLAVPGEAIREALDRLTGVEGKTGLDVPERTRFEVRVGGEIAGLTDGAVGIRNPRRIVRAGQCPGGQLAGAPLDAAGLH